jgi:hypothetical protein
MENLYCFLNYLLSNLLLFVILFQYLNIFINLHQIKTQNIFVQMNINTTKIKMEYTIIKIT